MRRQLLMAGIVSALALASAPTAQAMQPTGQYTTPGITADPAIAGALLADMALPWAIRALDLQCPGHLSYRHGGWWCDASLVALARTEDSYPTEQARP